MADAAREQAIAQIAADLLSRIDGTGNYAYTMRAVHRDPATLSQINAFMPCIEIAELDEAPDFGTTGGEHFLAELALLAYVKNDPSKAAATQVNNLQADLWRAMISDGQDHNGKTIRVIYRGAERLGPKGSPIIGIEALYGFTYAFARGEPTTFGPSTA